jgi:hypothetical protein
MDSAATRFKARLNYWTGRGFSGAELYAQLANDPEAPETYSTRDLADILGVGVLAIQKRRFRGDKPDFFRMSARHVVYARADICRFIAGRFVRQPEAA